MIEIIDIGLLATLQGKSYRGNRHLGMPLSGPADPVTMAIANRLAGNAYDAVTIEFSILGGIIKAHCDTVIGLAGPIDKLTIERDGIYSQYDHYSSIAMRKNDVMIIKAQREGAHIYLSVQGGFEADHHWDGNSTFLPAKIGGHNGRAIRIGDWLNHKNNFPSDNNICVPRRYRLSYNNHHILRICADNKNIAHYLSHNIWNIGRQSSRIGYELANDSVHQPNIYSEAQYAGLSRAVYPGNIQYPPSGTPFLLGVDAQTTGGYPLIGHVIRADRHIIGQIKSGDSLRFRIEKPHDARRVYENKLNMWRDYIPDLQLD